MVESAYHTVKNNLLGRSDTWVERNRMRFDKGNCGVLHLGRNNPMHQYKRGADMLERNSAEKDLEVSVEDRVGHEPAACPRQQEGQWYPEVY